MFNKPKKVHSMVVKVIRPVALESERRAALPTSEAAFHLNRSQQTLRLWAISKNAAIRPLRIGGRLAWPVSEIRRLLGVTA